MRQLLSLRFLAAVVALAAMAAGALVLQQRNTGLSGFDRHSDVDLRRLDVISVVTAFQTPSFELTGSGTAATDLVVNVQLAGESREVRVFPGTPGVVTCPELVDYGCALLGQSHGDTISWFALVPMQAGNQFRFGLPAVVDLVDGYARLENGWEVRYAPVIDRTPCPPEVANFREFLARQGTDFMSIYDLREQGIVAVECDATAVEPADSDPD